MEIAGLAVFPDGTGDAGGRQRGTRGPPDTLDAAPRREHCHSNNRNKRERHPMTKLATALISAAAMAAAVAVFTTIPDFAPAARAADLPPCSKTVNDRCMQIGGETMQPSPGVKAKQQENVKAAGKKAGEIGDKAGEAAKDVGKKIGEMGHKAKVKMEKMMGGPAPSSEIPHGCSPATVPCE